MWMLIHNKGGGCARKEQRYFGLDRRMKGMEGYGGKLAQ